MSFEVEVHMFPKSAKASYNAQQGIIKFKELTSSAKLLNLPTSLLYSIISTGYQ